MPNGLSETVNRRTYKTMAKRKTMIYKTLHLTLKIKQQELHKKKKKKIQNVNKAGVD